MRPTPKKTRLKENVLTDEDSIDSSGEEEEEPRIAHTVIKEHRKIASLPIRKAPPIVKPAAFAASSSPSAPSSSNGPDGELRTPRQGERRSLTSVTALTGKRLVLSSGVHEELPGRCRSLIARQRGRDGKELALLQFSKSKSRPNARRRDLSLYSELY